MAHHQNLLTIDPQMPVASVPLPGRPNRRRFDQPEAQPQQLAEMPAYYRHPAPAADMVGHVDNHPGSGRTPTTILILHHPVLSSFRIPICPGRGTRRLSHLRRRPRHRVRRPPVPCSANGAGGHAWRTGRSLLVRRSAYRRVPTRGRNHRHR